MTKKCSRCHADKPIGEFHARTEPHRYGELRHECKSCHHARGKAWRAANRERDRRTGRALHLRRQFGITLEDEARMIAACGNRCEICGLPPAGTGRSTSRLHVDHDSNTGKVRGLLCSKCNQGIGMFNHESQRLIDAAAYLAKRSSKHVA